MFAIMGTRFKLQGSLLKCINIVSKFPEDMGIYNEFCITICYKCKQINKKISENPAKTVLDEKSFMNTFYISHQVLKYDSTLFSSYDNNE